MLAGYENFVNDNVRTAHLKCQDCKTQVQLAEIATDDEGHEVRSFHCRHCKNVSAIRFDRNRHNGDDGILRDLSAG